MSMIVTAVVTSAVLVGGTIYNIVDDINTDAETREKEKKAEDENNRLIAEAKNKERLDEEARGRDKQRAKQRANQVSGQAANKGGTINTSPLGALGPLGQTTALGNYSAGGTNAGALKTKLGG